MMLTHDLDGGIFTVLNFPKSLFYRTLDLDASSLYNDLIITLEISGLMFPVMKH